MHFDSLEEKEMGMERKKKQKGQGKGKGKWSIGENCNWQHSMAHPRKPPYRHTDFADISYTRRVIANFVPNFLAMATGVSRGKMQLAAFDGPSRKPPYRRKNFEKIFYTSRVIVVFVPNFVAMATGVGRGKCSWQHSISHLENPSIGPKILQKSPMQAEL